MNARKVRIRIRSEQQGEETDQSVTADLYEREDALYYRYREPDAGAMGDTTTTVKVQGEGVQVIRHGEVRAEQGFRRHAKVSGYYARGPLKLQLQTETHEIRNDLQRGLGRLGWTYDVYVDEVFSHRVKIGLDIQEGTE